MTQFGRSFEDQVRQAARSVWNLSPGEGGNDFIAGREIDCVCRTPDVIHLIECTAQTNLKKVEEDTESLQKAKRHLESQGQTVKPWIVTLHEPTADQRAYTRNHNITITSLAQFMMRIFRAPDYLNARWRCRFGSASDPATGSHALADEEYIALPLRNIATGMEHSVPSVVNLLVQKKANVVLLGPFGAGKSLTVREVFKQMRSTYFKVPEQPVPVAISLSDHWGQEDTDEVLRRHAARVGFAGRDELVRAWNAGLLVLCLDGFDELASQSWRLAPVDMRKTRYEAGRLIRAFVKENQGRYGILITGRDHYFDSSEEMNRALALQSGCEFIAIQEFTETQAQRYLQRKGLNPTLPDWLPRKPLLLGYLASRNLLRDVLSIDGNKGVAHAWNVFLDKVCARESVLSKDIEGQSVRELLELLAEKARSTASGAGPLFESDLATAYRAVTGADPLEEARILLQRLPGLTVRDQQEGGRSFVDPDMLAALQGSRVARFVMNPFGPTDAEYYRHPLRGLGCAIAGIVAQQLGAKPAAHLTAAKNAMDRWNAATLAIDCILSAADRTDVEALDCDGLVVKEGLVDCLDLENLGISNIEFQWCSIGTALLGDTPPKGVRLYKCVVERVSGVSEIRGLPEWIVECDIGEFENVHTNAAIMRTNSPMPVRVLLTVLRKLFLQRGRARKESAFFRGLEPSAMKYVKPILELLRRSEVAHPITLADGVIWHPYRQHQGRVAQIIATLGTNDDALVRQASQLN